MRRLAALRGLPSALRELREVVAALRSDVSGTQSALLALRDSVAAVEGRVAAAAEQVERNLHVLQALHDDENANRRRVAALRESDRYAQAYEESEPLVSVIIPTYRNFAGLRDRALPSVLAQTYERLEVVIVGDGAPPETAAVVEELGEDRVRYHNLPVRGHYPENPEERWLVSGSVPFNEALRRARGHWIAPFADDDALRPAAVATMLAQVRERRLEGAYGVLNVIPPAGDPFPVGEFPPRRGGVGLQGGLFHGGLRFFEQRLSDALFGLPNDWAMLRRMLRAGVRWGFVDEVVCDYYPTTAVPAPRAASSSTT